ncbi:crossover junction endonuclease EME1B isoform X1 [Typha latifolia]|uniref:crossover junction endonuclease EME1B isoform X1 n=1 Tax=Typha latifolia TaxID=4733 RepID=UPI003C2F975F
MSQLPLAVEISDEDDSCTGFSPSPPPLKKRLGLAHGGGAPTFLVIDDDPTPQKPNTFQTPSVIPESPLSSDIAFDSVVRCSLPSSKANGSSEKFSGVSGLVLLESDNEMADDARRANVENPGSMTGGSGLTSLSEMSSHSNEVETPVGMGHKVYSRLPDPSRTYFSASRNSYDDVIVGSNKDGAFVACNGTMDFTDLVNDIPFQGDIFVKDILQDKSYSEEQNMFEHVIINSKREDKQTEVSARKNDYKAEASVRKKLQKEEKVRLREERKRKQQEEKLRKEAMKAEAAEMRKLEKEKQKWEKGKLALKSIVAEIDANVIENGSIGGHLLTRFAEKGLSFRITSNPIEGSILWRIIVPDHIAQHSSVGTEVPYVLLVRQAEEFCCLVTSESLMDHVHKVRNQYPSSTICYVTNKIMSYIKKCEQNQYKNPSNANNWRRPPVEEVLCKLTTHYPKVHSRQCVDEAELAEHVVGLTSSLANCHFRKKLTWLSVNANGSIIPKNFIDKRLIKKSTWLKALIAIPKVQPRYAIAIWKKYPTMRSLLNVYMDPTKSVHEKEFLLKDLMIEGPLGREERRLGEMCSKRVYRILMAQSGGIITDDVEDGADLFDP